MMQIQRLNPMRNAAMLFGAAALTLGSSCLALSSMPSAAAGGSKELKETMMKGMKEMEGMPMSGNTDHDFAMMMKRHHQDAIVMSETEIKSGKDAQMKAMAKKIIEAQRKEIKEFDDWLAKHK